MRWGEKLRMRLRMLLHRGRERERLKAELGFHLEQQIAENIAAGMTPEEARYAARRTFGNPVVLNERARETWSWNTMETILQNLRLSLRTLRRTPGFAFVAILIIAIGIGANVALFTVVRSVLLKPLPFKDPGRLIRLYESSSDNKFSYNTVAGGIFAAWKQESQSFSDLAILSGSQDYSLSGTTGQLPEKVLAGVCSASLFPTLGVEPALGRIFDTSDDQPSAGATVILSWGLWKRRYGGDPGILNQTIRLDAKSYTVIGVMPAWFAYPSQRVQVWTPIYHEVPTDEMQALDSHDFMVVGRLRPGVTESEGRAELSVIVRRIHDVHLDDPYISAAANSRPLLEAMVGDVKAPLYVLLAATGCVLLIACLNVANLLVARSASRRRELAIRTALGGGRLRLLGEHLTESFVISMLGGAAGLALADAVLQWLIATRQDLSRAESIHMDAVVVVFAVALTILCAAFAGFISSISASGDKVLASLQESSRSHSGGQSRAKLRRLLLALEVGLTVVLLIVAGLLTKSYQRLRATNLGCVTDNVLTLRFSLPETQYVKGPQRVNFFQTLLTRVRALPGVQSAGLVRAVPGEGYPGDSGFVIEGQPPLPTGQMQYAMVQWADPGYFAALGIPFLRGATFDGNPDPGRPLQVIVSSSFAKQYFHGENPIGKIVFTIGRKPFTVAGVAGDTRYEVAQPIMPTMYFPIYGSLYQGEVPSFAALAVHSTHDATTLALPIQQIIQELDPELAVSNILTMDQVVGKTTVNAGFDATLLLAFAVLSLVLAAVGLFGVLSYIVAQRTTEIGIRMALGAQRQTVLSLMMLDGLRPALMGLALGILASIAAAQEIRSMLYGVIPYDSSVFFGVVAILLVVAAAACLIPAWRASRLDPVVALRAQ
jgi:predicted permease